MRKTNPDVTNISAEVLNVALDMSLEWGENWLKDINERILEAYPKLTAEEADNLNRWCVEVRDFAYRLIECEYNPPKEKLTEMAIKQVRRKYPQINEENLAHLYNQGMYYAWHG